MTIPTREGLQVGSRPVGYAGKLSAAFAPWSLPRAPQPPHRSATFRSGDPKDYNGATIPDSE